MTAQGNAQTLYKDPNGGFTVQIPAGWQAQPQPGTPMVSFVLESKQASVTMGVVSGPAANTPTADKELDGIQSQFPQNCPGAKITQRGPTTLAGMPAVSMLVNCTDDKGGLETMKFAVASKPGLLVVLNSASPTANYAGVLPALNALEHSLKLLPGAGAQAAGSTPASSAGTYRDPQGRYSLTVPGGWNATADTSAGTAQLTSGASWATIAAMSGTQASDVNHQMMQQIQAQYTNFQMLNEGDLQVNGHPAHGANATGINPKGGRVSVLVLSIGAGGGHFLVVISSSPNEQAQASNASVMQMAQSIRFAGE